jgi:hypothetical protein
MPTITDAMSRRVLFTDGEGVEPDDFNDQQTYLYAQLVENLLMSAPTRALDAPTLLWDPVDLELGDTWNDGSVVQTTDVFAPYASAGYVRATAAANELVTVPGPIMQVVGSLFDGSGESVALFRLGSTTLTTAAGDATHPRIDLVEVKLAFVDADQEARDFMDASTGAITTTNPYKTRRVTCSIQIKQGTPAATPAYPTPTAGYAALAAVYVPAAHNAAHSADNLRDHRFPLGSVRVYDTPANEFWRPGGSPWTVNQEQYATDPGGGATASVYAYCPRAGKNARLMGVTVYGRWGDGANSNVQLVRTLHQLPSTPAHTTIATPSTSLLNGTVALRTISALDLADQLAANGTHKGTRVSNTRIGVPLWMNGYPAGVAHPEPSSAPSTTTMLGLKITSQSTSDPAFVSFVRWYVSEGL